MNGRTDDNQITSFLHTIFPDLGQQWLLLWKLSKKESKKESCWTQTIGDAEIEKIFEWAKSLDVYVGCGFRSKNFGPHERGKTTDVSGIPGVWLDVDYGPSHKKPNLPPTEEAAMSLIEAMGPPPTLIVHSGHGLQPWWAFKEPWIFENDEERTKAAALVSAWNRTLIAKAKGNGWTADNVGDLARVMRIPGTWNRKGVEVPTKLLTFSDYRFDPSAFDEYFDQAAEQESEGTTRQWSFKLNPLANPPLERFSDLFENNTKFKGSWNHTRKMDSTSEYDLSLATLAMLHDWPEQEIVDLLIAHRRKYGEDLKLREDYYTRTLNKSAKGQPEAPEESADTGGAIQSARQELSKMLNLDISKVSRYGKPPCHYEMVVGSQKIALGYVDSIDSQLKFRRIMMDAMKVQIPGFKKKKWFKVKDLFLKACEEIDGGPELDRWESFKGAIRTFMESDFVVRYLEAEWQVGCLSHQPFQKYGKQYLAARKLCRFLNFHLGEKWTQRQVALRLKEIGAISLKMTVSTKTINVSRTGWQLPDDFKSW